MSKANLLINPKLLVANLQKTDLKNIFLLNIFFSKKTTLTVKPT